MKVSEKNNESRIEKYIVTKKLDSARIFLSKKQKTDYENLLLKIASNKKLSYKEYNFFITKVTNQRTADYELISGFIDERIAFPTDLNVVDIDFTAIKLGQITILRNNGNIDEASTKNDQLEKYLEEFDQNSKEVKIQRAYLNINDAVMFYIQRNFEAGKKILNESLEVARLYKDTELEIASLYYLSDFLVEEKKLDEFILITEKSLALEKQLPKKSSFYEATIQHAINAYIFKGGQDKRVQSLLDELYTNPELTTKADSYSLYAQYLSTLDPNSKFKKEIFKKFDVTNSKEFCDLIVEEAEPLLNDNEFYFVLTEASKVLEHDNYLKEAIRYQERAVVLTRKTYSEDLANSLSDFKTKQAVKEKEKEITYAKERTKLYMVIASLVCCLFIISIIVLARRRKQSQLLKIKNQQINKTLKEKELLVKEIHHRVKNNFQIVSSLLELQTKGIEDGKALELAAEGQNRIKSMALIHQKLYQNEEGLIDFDEYIHQLVKELTALFASSKKVVTNISSKSMMFDIDTAIPLGLIINELITNAYKYAFKHSENSQLNIAIDKVDGSNYKLTVSDNGNGLDPAFNIKKAKSLGLRLVNRLAKQLQGTVTLINNQGASFEILFKDTQARRSMD